jgi:hypothetical protein
LQNVTKKKSSFIETALNCIFFAANSPVQSEPDVNPCEPTPCGPNAQCKSTNGQPVCSCLPEMTGSPPNCRSECTSNANCPSNQTCVNQKCVDVCPGICDGHSPDCEAVDHYPICLHCPTGYTGIPSRYKCSMLIIDPPEPENPCQPSPCGPNAQCKEHGGSRNAPLCSCSPGMVGSPPNCRPECAINLHCPSEKACIRSKCQDPCPGSCGDNTDCNIINHLPTCSCLQGYVGDPFIACRTLTSGNKTSNPCDANPCDTSDCIVNSDCPANKAFANGKCKDPYAGVW